MAPKLHMLCRVDEADTLYGSNPGRRWPEIIAAALLLAIGQAVAVLCVAQLGPPGGAARALLPPWAFGAAWTLLYPCFAVSALTVWRERPELRTASTPSTLSVLAVILGWMPVTCAAQQPWVTVAMDVLAWAVVWVAAASYVRMSRTAGRWMLPLVCWMPATTTLSLLAALQH